jgi:hypothetical protein
MSTESIAVMVVAEAVWTIVVFVLGILIGIRATKGEL